MLNRTNMRYSAAQLFPRVESERSCRVYVAAQYPRMP